MRENGRSATGAAPRERYELSALRALAVSGAPIHPDAARRVIRALGEHTVPLSMSGGTDICSAFLQPAPGGRIRADAIAARALGVDAAVFDPAGHAVRERMGELVVRSPLPSMPLRLWGDEDGARYRASYYEQYPGTWCHGDAVTEHEDGSYVMHGRSDSTLNRGGVLDLAVVESLTLLGLGGEAVDPETWARMSALARTRVVNFYGPTEATVDACVAEFAEHSRPVLGRPVHGMRATVLDGLLRPVFPGGIGELYLGGPQLARGYEARPAETAARFTADPLGGGRCYRTGDLVRVELDGTLSYLGRADGQVKIRGHRIELGEVEAALRRIESVAAAAVVARERPDGTVLRAAVVLDPGVSIDVSRIRASLARSLPPYMLPGEFVHLPELPLTRNGKLDAEAVRRAQAVRPAGGGGALTPREQLLVEAVGDALGEAAVPGLDEELAAAGLDSVATVAIVAACRRRGLMVRVLDVVAARTLRELAAAGEPAAEAGAASGCRATGREERKGAEGR